MPAPASLLAAVDLGSNAFRMVIGHGMPSAHGHHFYELETLREPVRLAEGLQHNNELDKHAMIRGLRALDKFGSRLRGFQAGQVRAVATNTVRIAVNADVFLAEARERLGFPIEVISGQEEARLVYAGIAHAHADVADERLVVDIGGGSTELIVGRGATPFALESLPIGSGTFSKRYFPDGRISSQAFQEAEWHAASEFEKVAAVFRQHRWQQAIGSSGTARVLAKVLRTCGLNDKGAGAISYSGLLRLTVQLLDAGRIDRLKLPGIEESRLATLPGGVAIMLAAFKSLAITQMETSRPALRLGLLHSLHCQSAVA
ncbi:exopolyphosphatase / guanosine-5'-triphosphate,3'-diphosphate pyrophosphatase [Vogesella sp. LIG4]|nr:exopolyphosphatase / guanosine-5'-triphosphate,3'-diphosphate pyrophosphatase [Vogesella sp. LIG4]